MADGSLRSRIDRLIEELIHDSAPDAATLASLLIAVQVALRADELSDLAKASWEFVDSRRLPRTADCTAERMHQVTRRAALRHTHADDPGSNSSLHS